MIPSFNLERSASEAIAEFASKHNSSGEGNPQPRSLAQLESSQAAMRQTTKWLVAATAAVGAVLVAGLQLSNLPYGFIASITAIVGVAFALIGVAMILSQAAAVLSAGYTTFGEIADLDQEPTYLKEQRQGIAWAERINTVEKFIRTYPHNRVRILIVIYGAVAIAILRVRRKLTLRHAKNEGIRIADMLRYLNRDVFFFTGGLASDIPELYGRLEATDREVLSLRGQKPSAYDKEDEEDEAHEDVSSKTRSFGEILLPRWAKLYSAWKSKQRTVAAPALLSQAEWRQDRLETAAGEIIAFANQRLIEHRFRGMQSAIWKWGIVIVAGTLAFAVAPKFAKPKPLPITQPTRVTVSIIGDGLGKECPPNLVLPGVAVGGTWDQPIVVTAKAGSCSAQRVTLDSDQGVVLPVISVPPSVPPSTNSETP